MQIISLIKEKQSKTPQNSALNKRELNNNPDVNFLNQSTNIQQLIKENPRGIINKQRNHAIKRRRTHGRWMKLELQLELEPNIVNYSCLIQDTDLESANNQEKEKRFKEFLMRSLYEKGFALKKGCLSFKLDIFPSIFFFKILFFSSSACSCQATEAKF